MTLRAYEVYKHVFAPQEALITGECRGGFGVGERSTQLLQEYKVPFASRNMGAHLIVSYEGTVVDFWPGTGKFIVRGTHQKRRGVFNLLRVLGLTVLDKKN